MGQRNTHAGYQCEPLECNLLGVSSSQCRAPLPELTSPGDWQLRMYVSHCDPSLVEHYFLWGVIPLGLPTASNTR